jgi:hypothetical protein
MKDLDGYQIWITKGTDLGPQITLHLADGNDVEFLKVGEISEGEDAEPDFVEVTNHDSEGQEFIPVE